MTISLGDAIACIKKEPKWFKKILVIGLAVIGVGLLQSLVYGFFGITPTTEESVASSTKTAAAFMSFLISLPLSAYIVGWFFQSMHKNFNSDRFQIVELSQKNLLIDGIKYIFSLIGYYIIIEIILLVVTLIVILTVALIGFLMSSILSSIMGQEACTVFIVLFAVVIGLVLGLYYTQFINAAFACYIKTLNFGDFIAFNKHFNIIKDNKHAAWSLIGKNILFSLLLALIVFALCISLIGVMLLPFVVVYAYFVAFNLLNQYAKEIKIEKYL